MNGLEPALDVGRTEPKIENLVVDVCRPCLGTGVMYELGAGFTSGCDRCGVGFTGERQ